MIRLMDLLRETKEHRIYTNKIEGTLSRLSEIVSTDKYTELMEVYAELKIQIDEINVTPYNRSTLDVVNTQIRMTAWTLTRLSEMVETLQVECEVEHADLFTNAVKAINEIYEY